MGCPTIALATALTAAALQPPPDRWATRGPPMDLVEPKALSRFVTQRSVQQQLYYFSLTADGTSHDYLAEYLRPPPGDDEYRTRLCGNQPVRRVHPKILH